MTRIEQIGAERFDPQIAQIMLIDDTVLVVGQIRCFHESAVAWGAAALQRIRGRNGFDLVARRRNCRQSVDFQSEVKNCKDSG